MVTSVKSFCRHVRRPGVSGGYAVYLGLGVYLSAYTLGGHGVAGFESVHFDGKGSAANLEKREAVKALHATRAAGLSAWVVPYVEAMVAA